MSNKKSKTLAKPASKTGTLTLKGLTLEKVYPFIILVAGSLGLLASFILTVDKIKLLKDPTFIPDCNINPIFSCGSVMKTQQAEIFGIPNTLFGILAFSVIITVAICVLFGARMKPWFWRLFTLGTAAGLAGVIYLFFQGIYRINAICPYCALTWVVVLALFIYGLAWNIRQKFIVFPKPFQKLANFIATNHTGILLLTYIGIIVLILNHFWYYFGR